MEIIRDEDNEIMMLPLLCDWGIKRCNYVDCRTKPNTIILNIHPDAPKAVGLCEEHFQLGNKPGVGKVNMQLQFGELSKE